MIVWEDKSMTAGKEVLSRVAILDVFFKKRVLSASHSDFLLQQGLVLSEPMALR